MRPSVSHRMRAHTGKLGDAVQNPGMFKLLRDFWKMGR